MFFRSLLDSIKSKSTTRNQVTMDEFIQALKEGNESIIKRFNDKGKKLLIDLFNNKDNPDELFYIASRYNDLAIFSKSLNFIFEIGLQPR
jgi:hypothetical protein